MIFSESMIGSQLETVKGPSRETSLELALTVALGLSLLEIFSLFVLTVHGSLCVENWKIERLAGVYYEAISYKI